MPTDPAPVSLKPWRPIKSISPSYSEEDETTALAEIGTTNTNQQDKTTVIANGYISQEEIKGSTCFDDRPRVDRRN